MFSHSTSPDLDLTTPQPFGGVKSSAGSPSGAALTKSTRPVNPNGGAYKYAIACDNTLLFCASSTRTLKLHSKDGAMVNAVIGKMAAGSAFLAVLGGEGVLADLVFCTRADSELVSDTAGNIGRLSEDDTGRVSARTGVIRSEPPGVLLLRGETSRVGDKDLTDRAGGESPPLVAPLGTPPPKLSVAGSTMDLLGETIRAGDRDLIDLCNGASFPEALAAKGIDRRESVEA
mmetsp:Transcript_69696/g.130069  ORF Transcript_69696/g.130069 Transcript_69696/m.130069 type:complete len:231 (-) Transcript_69696:3589-4281(-)